MCDTIECMEILTTILNIHIPAILPSLNNYVVKGGRASDFYISQYTGKELIRFTDWDLACNSRENQTVIKDKVITYLNQQGITNIATQTITTQDDKLGIQLGIKCNGTNCFFIDIVIYPPSDPIFNSNQTNKGINYVNLNYLFDDLNITNTERIQRLIEELDNFNIINIDVNNLTNDINFYIDDIRNQLIKKRTLKAENDISEILKDTDLNDIEKEEDIEETNKKFSDDISYIISEILPTFRTNFEKLIRTNERFKKISSLIQQKAGKKRKTKKIIKKNNVTIKKRR